MNDSYSRNAQSFHKSRNNINYIGERVNVCKEQSSLRCQRTYSSLSKKEKMQLDAKSNDALRRPCDLRHAIRFSSHKGMSFTIETTIVIILAILVLAVLVFFFMNYFGGSENEVARQVKQKDNCLAYARANPKCSYTLNNRVSSSVRTTLEDVCKKMSFPECSNPPLGIPCVRQCCKEYCSGGANRCVEDLGGNRCTTSTSPTCATPEIPEGNADCQQTTSFPTSKCCK